MRQQILLVMLLMGLGGCSEEAPRATVESAPATFEEAVGPVVRQVQSLHDLSLLGSWHTPLVAGHIPYALGYYNCIGFNIGEINVTRLEVQATWAARSPAEERLSLFHSLKSDNQPYRDVRHDTGASPLVHRAELDKPMLEEYLGIGVQSPADSPAGFGTVEKVQLVVTLQYEGELEPTLRGASTCGHEL